MEDSKFETMVEMMHLYKWSLLFDLKKVFCCSGKRLCKKLNSYQSLPHHMIDRLLAYYKESIKKMKAIMKMRLYSSKQCKGFAQFLLTNEQTIM